MPFERPRAHELRSDPRFSELKERLWREIAPQPGTAPQVDPGASGPGPSRDVEPEMQEPRPGSADTGAPQAGRS